MSAPKGQRSRQGSGAPARAPGQAQSTPATPPGSDGPRSRPRRSEQVWAERAWGWVELAVQTNNEKFHKRYGTLARKLPSYLQVNGLGQTMAFLYSKWKEGTDSGGAEQMLCRQLGTYLREVLGRPTDQAAPAGEIMRFVIDCEPDEYRRASREASGVSQWLKRFAEGRFGTEQDDE